MHTLNRRHALALGLLALVAVLSRGGALGAELYRAQGEMTGEVSATSAIVQTRLTSVKRNVDGDVGGAAGVVRFEYAENGQFERSRLTPWGSAGAESDYIVKAVLGDLKPATRYYYRVIYGVDRENTRVGPTCSFRTLQGASGTDSVSFVVVTGMNYSSFHGRKRKEKGPRRDRAAGYPALATMIGMKLDFFVGTGDNVYYDGRTFRAETLPDLRRKWHEQLVQSRFVELFRNVPTYWEAANFRKICEAQYAALNASPNYSYLIHDGGDTMPSREAIAWFKQQFGETEDTYTDKD